jgi:hypothetical protein
LPETGAKFGAPPNKDKVGNKAKGQQQITQQGINENWHGFKITFYLID